MAIWEAIIIAPLAARTADFTTPDMRAHGATGIDILVHVGTAGASTLTLQIFGREPFEATAYQINVDVALAAGRNQVILYPGVSKQPPGESAATSGANVKQLVGIAIPDSFHIKFAKGDGSAWTYGAILRRIP